MDAAASGKTFYASDIVWYNRLKLYNCDTDSWVFHTFDINHNAQKGITLEGNFVRFAANETIVIMERGGKYYAYSLLDGKEVTQDIKDGNVSMYAHEQLVTLCKDGVLLVTNMFTGQQQTLGQADMCVLSSDGAFAFVYCDGDSYVTCYNVASGENCRIGIDKEMCEQLFAREDAVLQMSYNEQENTLLLSYYAEKDVSGRYDTNVDFYDLLAQLQDENSLLNFLKQLIAYNKANPALWAEGELEVLDPGYPFVYTRSAGDKKVLVAINPSGTCRYCKVPEFQKVIFNQNTRMQDGLLVMEEVSFLVAEL
jgi:hypothetical protein